MVARAIERDIATKQSEHDDATTPQVAHLVVPLCDNLRRNVVGRPDHFPQHRSWSTFASETEVDQFQRVVHIDRPLAAEDKVLRFEVPVSDGLFVHVMHRPEDLLQDNRGRGFVQVTFTDNFVEQLTSAAQLHDQICVEAVAEGFIEPHDVRMVQPSHDIDLLLEGREVDLFLGDLLDRSHDPCLLPRGSENNALCALAGLVADIVFLLGVLLPVRDKA
mmetsp:Transcript_42877/g.121201  ORF Transcript_42877/g.121201 Transcript_42877/m.121201 type:complete len:219 (-) Transcript_42877:278-934(-)